jgi:hypothetical protein
MVQEIQADPLEGKEIELLNRILAALHAKAASGDEAAVDRVIKILELKRKYRRDRQIEEI